MVAMIIVYVTAEWIPNQTGSGGGSLLNMGYQNCFMCHAGGKNPMSTRHCSQATLDQCLDCHIDMVEIAANEISGSEITYLRSYGYACLQCHGIEGE